MSKFLWAASVVLFVGLVPALGQEVSKDLSLPPEDPASPLYPRRFGLPGGIGASRGWYVWRSFNPKTWEAEISPEGSKEVFKSRVLPWVSTYRHLAYGAHPEDLLPGERVNIFFNPDAKHRRAYMVYYQDELCQMKGHYHGWQVIKPTKDGFTARVIAGSKPFDDREATFVFDPKVQVYRDGKLIDKADVKMGEKVYLTFVYTDNDKTRLVKLLSDDASLKVIEDAMKKKVAERITKEGMASFVEEVAKDKAKVLVFSTWWRQANDLKPGQQLRLLATDAQFQPVGAAVTVKLLTRKNLGTYGSGCNELFVTLPEGAQLDTLRGWTPNKIVRLFP